MSITNNLSKLNSKINTKICLVAVSKTKPISDILEAYNFGHKIFGENKVQELVSKHNSLPKDISWHMIGHLQRNKVKYIASFIDLIHGVDNIKLIKEINKQGLKNSRVINCLIQVNISNEENKFGMNINETYNLFKTLELTSFKNLNIVGLMGMGSFTNDEEFLKNQFLSLKKLFDKLNSEKFNLSVLSMGMINDYRLAIECGSNMIRVGNSIFGSRK
jgi:pyridoxal phosphate enzyme (YggS family)